MKHAFCREVRFAGHRNADFGRRIAALDNRGRGRESRSSPSLRTVQADLPHTALQSVVLPPGGLTNRSCPKEEKLSDVRRDKTSHLSLSGSSTCVTLTGTASSALQLLKHLQLA